MSVEAKRCLVTGAAGFIGSHLARRLVDEGAEVHALVRPGTALDKIVGIADRITIHRVDLTNRQQLETCLKAVEPEYVFHLGAPTRGASQPTIEAARFALDAILSPLLDLVDILASLPHPPLNFVRAGTIAEPGHIATPFREEQREEPVTPYGAAMLAGTQHLALLAKSLPFPVVSARLALTYGIGQSSEFLVPSLFEACLTGNETLVRRPQDRRDLIHVDDVVDALILLALSPQPGAPHVNICSGIAPTVAEVAAMVCEAMDADPGLIRMGSTAPDEPISEHRSDPRLASQLYGWEARIPIEQGIRMIADELIGELDAKGHARG